MASQRFKGALQLLMNRDGYIRFAQVHERVSTKSFVVMIIESSRSFHLGAQGTFNRGAGGGGGSGGEPGDPPKKRGGVGTR